MVSFEVYKKNKKKRKKYQSMSVKNGCSDINVIDINLSAAIIIGCSLCGPHSFIRLTIPLSIGPNGEPKITHGHTLVSDLSLREVAKTIDVRFDYIERTTFMCVRYRNMPSTCQFILLFYHWRIIVLKNNRYNTDRSQHILLLSSKLF